MDENKKKSLKAFNKQKRERKKKLVKIIDKEVKKDVVPQVIKGKKKNRGVSKKRVVQYIPEMKAVPASNVVSTIEISSIMCPDARLTWSCALISRLATLDTTNLAQIYYVYQIMDTDFISVLKNSTPVIFSRVAFVNTLFELIKAKTVNTPRMNVSYQFNSTLLSGAPSPALDIRNYFFYMFNPGVDSGMSLSIMTVPPVVTDDVALLSYNSALPKWTPNIPKRMLMQEEIDNRSLIFEKDASGYAQRAGYVKTQGSCPSGGYSSAESEVYCGALSTLSVFVELPEDVPNDPLLRTALNFNFASGDTTCAFGYPFLDGFKMLDYSTRLPPIIKYIDFSQLWTVYVQWFGEVLRKGAAGPGGKDVEVLAWLTNPVPLVYAIIAFRQSVLKYLATAQACTQFQTYESFTNDYFEPLRVGTNTASRLAIPLDMPVLLVENIRALAPKRYCADGNRSEKRCRWYLPCVGLKSNSQFLNPLVTINDVQYNTFDPVNPAGEAGINFIDGSGPNNVFDFNSTVIGASAQQMNLITVSINSAVCGDTGPLEGTSSFNLLAFTRYDEVNNVSYTDETFASMPKWMLNGNHSLYKDYSAKKAEFERTRTKSSKNLFSYKVGAGVTALVPRSYSSSVVITKEIMDIMETLVIPSVECYNDATTPIVSQQGFQTAFSETQSYEVNQPTEGQPGGLISVGAMLSNLGISLAPGVAAHPSLEVSRAMTTLQETDRGSFLLAALAGVTEFLRHVI